MSRPGVCLLYHDVTTAEPRVSGGPAHFAVSRRALERQLGLLRDWGYQGCSIAAGLNDPTERSVAISFDDGQLGQFAYALPILTAHATSATFFVTTSWVGRPGYMSWDQLREMKAAGMSIQSHTHTHPFLSELDASDLEFELRTSKMELDEHLEQETDALALPGGDWPRRALRLLLRECGYEVVATSRWGTRQALGRHSGEPILVPRCTVRGEPSDRDFRRIITADPWLASRRQLRDGILRTLRSGLGPTRYSIWRGRFLEALSRRP